MTLELVQRVPTDTTSQITQILVMFRLVLSALQPKHQTQTDQLVDVPLDTLGLRAIVLLVVLILSNCCQCQRVKVVDQSKPRRQQRGQLRRRLYYILCVSCSSLLDTYTHIWIL